MMTAQEARQLTKIAKEQINSAVESHVPEITQILAFLIKKRAQDGYTSLPIRAVIDTLDIHSGISMPNGYSKQQYSFIIKQAAIHSGFEIRKGGSLIHIIDQYSPEDEVIIW